MAVRVSNFLSNGSPLTDICLEKYLKKLIGKTDMEDALKKLDMLTNEEARMATAQVLKATHAVDDRVAGVDDKVASVDNRVEGVEVRVASVDDKVKAVDDKVAVVIGGMQSPAICHQGNRFNSNVSRGKRDKGSHTTDCKRHGSSETFVILSALILALGMQLKRPRREPITTGFSQMALSAGPVY
jgi:hypothetical protein